MGCKSVVVVEDDDGIRTTLEETLEHEGYEVFTAAHGQDGLDLLKQVDPPGLILLDLQMPIMDGLQFLAEKAANASIAGIPVVVISAALDMEKMVRGKAQGCIEKPIPHEDLMAYVHRYCDSISSSSESAKEGQVE